MPVSLPPRQETETIHARELSAPTHAPHFLSRVAASLSVKLQLFSFSSDCLVLNAHHSVINFEMTNAERENVGSSRGDSEEVGKCSYSEEDSTPSLSYEVSFS